MVQALSWRGRVRLNGGDAQAANADFASALRLVPSDARARCWLAEALTALGDEPGALKAYRQGLARASTAPAFGFLARAVLNSRAGRWEQARADYAAAFALDVKSKEARLGLADCRRRMGTNR